MSAVSLHRRTAIVVAFFALAVSSCSKRDPAIDTTKPVASPAPSKPPSVYNPGGNGSATPYRPYTPPATIPGGSGNGGATPYRPNTPGTPISPAFPNNNSNIVPPSRPITPPSAPNVLPPVRPNAPNVIPSPPVVPSQPPAVNGGVSIAMQVVMTQDGPKVKAAIPANVTNLNMRYLSVAGMTEGTYVDVSLSFSNGAKKCSIDNTRVGTDSQTVTVPCS